MSVKDFVKFLSVYPRNTDVTVFVARHHRLDGAGRLLPGGTQLAEHHFWAAVQNLAQRNQLTAQQAHCLLNDWRSVIHGAYDHGHVCGLVLTDSAHPTVKELLAWETQLTPRGATMRESMSARWSATRANFVPA